MNNRHQLCAGFIIRHSDISLLLLRSSPSSLAEMEKWMQDIKMAIDLAKTSNGPTSDVLTCTLTDNSKLDGKQRESIS